MSSIALYPGVWRLTKDLENPRPDRRTRDDWRKAPIWKAGMLFIVTQRHSDPWGDGSKDYAYCDLNSAGSRWSHHTISLGEQYELIVANLEPHPETDETLLARLGVRSMSMYRFARFLVKKLGRIEFTALWEEWHAEPEPDDVPAEKDV